MDWSQLAENSLSATFGGGLALLGVYFTNRASEKTRRKEMLRARGEELYALNSKFVKGLSSYFLRRMSVVYGNLSYNQMLDLEIEDLKRNTYDLSRIEMLVDVYFPDARSAYDRLIEARDALNEVALKHKQACASGNRTAEQFEELFTTAIKRVDASGKSLGEIVLNALRSL